MARNPHPSGSEPGWVTAINRMIESTWLTVAAVALFGIDGTTRLLDGKLLRGFANLGIGMWLLTAHFRRNSRPAKDRSSPRAAAWFDEHPVMAALAIGIAWGVAMPALLIVTQEGPIRAALALGVGAGVLFFGPLVVLLSRRYGH